MKQRFVVVKLLDRNGGWCVDDSERNTTKVVFYDEAAEQLARDFCRQINKAVKAAKR